MTIIDVNSTIFIQQEVENLLRSLGQGHVAGVAYDTAWVARLASKYPGYGFEKCISWLRQHQFEDGSWGAPLLHYHDRFISTLAAIVALREVGDGLRDERRIKFGEQALWRLVGKLNRDDSDTVGFPILSTALAEEARNLGLEVPTPPLRYAHPYKRKVQALLNDPNRHWRNTTVTFSLEGLYKATRPYDDILEANHSVSVSPAATAAYLLAHRDDKALHYLSMSFDNDSSGSMRAFNAIEVFEVLWSLKHFYRAGLIQPDNAEVIRLMDFIWTMWSPKFGLRYSPNFPIEDVDDTAAGFTLLKWAGYEVSADVFKFYEREDHFCTYDKETNPSPSSHMRVLTALSMCDDHPECERWIRKAIAALQRFDENGSFWWDKWHASPYYASNLAIHAFCDMNAADIIESRVQWILRTQLDDGGWGYWDKSTIEETAYCLDALLTWNKQQEKIEREVLDRAYNFIIERYNDAKLSPMWLGKSLYTPELIVKSAILSAMYSYQQLDL